MDRSKKILSRLVYAVAHHNKNLWWELKRQIFDFGYQAYYPRQDEFKFAAKHVRTNLAPSDQKILIDEWRKNHPNYKDHPDIEVLISYVPVLIDQVVKRARSAAHRTNNW